MYWLKTYTWKYNSWIVHTGDLGLGIRILRHFFCKWWLLILILANLPFDFGIILSSDPWLDNCTLGLNLLIILTLENYASWIVLVGHPVLEKLTQFTLYLLVNLVLEKCALLGIYLLVTLALENTHHAECICWPPSQ